MFQVGATGIEGGGGGEEEEEEEEEEESYSHYQSELFVV
jgi:hypothetical protein